MRIDRKELLRAGLASAVLLAAGMSALPTMGYAAEIDPAVARVEAFDTALVALVRTKTATVSKLRPLIDDAFNLPVMAQLTVGSSWTGMSASERSSIVEALSRYLAARHAHEFADFTAERINVDRQALTRGPDKLVRAEVIEKGAPPVKLGYRLREYDGAWKIIDVIFQGVSQLTTQRSDFASAVETGGASALVKKLNEAAARLK